MVDSQPSAEDSLQAGGDLHRERYLGKQVEHLLATVDGALYEVDIELGLAARGDAVEQRHPVGHHLDEQPVVGIGLRRRERLDVLRRRLSATVEAAHLALVGREYAALL